MADASRAAFEWGAAIEETFSGLSQQIVLHTPQLLGAAGLLLLGWILAKALSLSARKLVEGFDALFVRFMHAETIQRERIQRSYALIISQLVYWVVMIFFLAVSANVLGWDLFSGWLDSVVGYLPGLVTGLLIILAGILFGSLARAAIHSATHRSAPEQSAMMARGLQVVIVFSAVIIGVEQIGLNIGFLSTLIVVVVAGLLGGAALAFGLGARSLVANIIGAQYTRRHCQVGDLIRLGATEGEVIEIAQAGIVIATAEGKAIIPARLFQEEVCHIIERGPRNAEPLNHA
jgi:small-conductance mechanosensitive channel